MPSWRSSFSDGARRVTIALLAPAEVRLDKDRPAPLPTPPDGQPIALAAHGPVTAQICSLVGSSGRNYCTGSGIGGVSVLIR
jgi:hypothetical protein